MSEALIDCKFDFDNALGIGTSDGCRMDLRSYGQYFHFRANCSSNDSSWEHHEEGTYTIQGSTVHLTPLHARGGGGYCGTNDVEDTLAPAPWTVEQTGPWTPIWKNGKYLKNIAAIRSLAKRSDSIMVRSCDDHNYSVQTKPGAWPLLCLQQGKAFSKPVDGGDATKERIAEAWEGSVDVLEVLQRPLYRIA